MIFIFNKRIILFILFFTFSCDFLKFPKKEKRQFQRTSSKLAIELNETRSFNIRSWFPEGYKEGEVFIIKQLPNSFILNNIRGEMLLSSAKGSFDRSLVGEYNMEFYIRNSAGIKNYHTLKIIVFPFKGKGTQSNPYIIDSMERFELMSHFKGYFRLEMMLDFGGKFLPSQYSILRNVKLDGNQKNGMKLMNINTTGCRGGIFEYLENVEIHDLEIENFFNTGSCNSHGVNIGILSNTARNIKINYLRIINSKINNTGGGNITYIGGVLGRGTNVNIEYSLLKNISISSGNNTTIGMGMGLLSEGGYFKNNSILGSEIKSTGVFGLKVSGWIGGKMGRDLSLIENMIISVDLKLLPNGTKKYTFINTLYQYRIENSYFDTSTLGISAGDAQKIGFGLGPAGYLNKSSYTGIDFNNIFLMIKKQGVEIRPLK